MKKKLKKKEIVIKKYVKFLNEVKRKCNKGLLRGNMVRLMSKHNLTYEISSILVKMGILSKRENSSWKWDNRRSITIQMAYNINLLINRYRSKK